MCCPVLEKLALRSYSTEAIAPVTKAGNSWHSIRLEGKQLMKLKNVACSS